MKYQYFTKYLATEEVDSELKAFGDGGWKLIHTEHHEQSPNWFTIFIKEEENLVHEKLAWYILDEIAVKHSATHCGSGNNPCQICDRAEEAMRLLNKPTPEECQEFYNERK